MCLYITSNLFYLAKVTCFYILNTKVGAPLNFGTSAFALAPAAMATCAGLSIICAVTPQVYKRCAAVAAVHLPTFTYIVPAFIAVNTEKKHSYNRAAAQIFDLRRAPFRWCFGNSRRRRSAICGAPAHRWVNIFTSHNEIFRFIVVFTG